MNRTFIILFLFVVILSALYSCNKGSDSTIVPVPIKPDTLSAGWSKITIGSSLISDIVFTNALTGYLLCNSAVYKSVDGGVSWTKLSTTITYAENIAACSDGKIFIATHSDTIFRSADGGASFTYIKTNHPTLDDIYFTDNNTGYTVYSSGLLQTTDGGVSWNVVSPVNGLTLVSNDYNTNFFISSSAGWISNGRAVYKISGNINTWIKSTFSGTAPVGFVTSLYATSASAVYAGCNDGRIFKSTDGGANFSPLPGFADSASTYLDLNFVDASNGYASSRKRIYKTTDGGSSWTPVVSLGESSFVEIHFTDANHGWGCTDKGEVLRYNQ